MTTQNTMRHWNPCVPTKDLTMDERYTVSQRRKDSLIPVAFYDACLDNLGEYYPLVTQVIEDIRDGNIDGIVLSGRPGRGKTYCACAILNSLFPYGRGIFLSMEMLKEAIHSGNSRLLERAKGTDLLILDDVGHSKMTPWFIGQLHEIIDARVSNKRPTIITTNYQNLYQRLSAEGENKTAEAIMSRLRAFNVIEIKGEDRRGTSFDQPSLTCC